FVNVDAAILLELGRHEVHELVPGGIAGQRGTFFVLDPMPLDRLAFGNQPAWLEARQLAHSRLGPNGKGQQAGTAERLQQVPARERHQALALSAAPTCDSARARTPSMNTERNEMAHMAHR